MSVLESFVSEGYLSFSIVERITVSGVLNSRVAWITNSVLNLRLLCSVSSSLCILILVLMRYEIYAMMASANIA